MKTFIWILKYILSVVLLFMITGDTFLGKEILWSDLKVIIWIDVLLLICLHPIVKPFSEPKEQHKDTILYILIYDNTIQGFGYSMQDLIYALNQARQTSMIMHKDIIKITKITITKNCIKSEDIFIE
jgi:hypothetical protein